MQLFHDGLSLTSVHYSDTKVEEDQLFINKSIEDLEDLINETLNQNILGNLFRR